MQPHLLQSQSFWFHLLWHCAVFRICSLSTSWTKPPNHSVNTHWVAPHQPSEWILSWSSARTHTHTHICPSDSIFCRTKNDSYSIHLGKNPFNTLLPPQNLGYPWIHITMFVGHNFLVGQNSPMIPSTFPTSSPRSHASAKLAKSKPLVERWMELPWLHWIFLLKFQKSCCMMDYNYDNIV